MQRLQALALALAVGAMASGAQAETYNLPFWSGELNAGERVFTFTHSDGIGGIQKRGKDLAIRQRTADGGWSSLKAGAPAQEANSDHLAYGKPFYAMASGEVVACWRNAPENARPHVKHPKLLARRIPGSGNHLWVLHADGVYTLYAHAIPGSIPSSLCPHDAALLSADNTPFSSHPDISPEGKIPAGSRPKVTRGQQLGRIGATGDSDGPHLHVHMERNSAAWPMKFQRGLSTPLKDATLDGPWEPLGGEQIPNGQVLVWLPRTLGGVDERPGVQSDDFGRMFEHLANSGYAPDKITCQRKNGEIYYNSTWRPSTGAWKAYFGKSESSYNALKADLKKDGYGETWRSICDDGARHAGVFRK